MVTRAGLVGYHVEQPRVVPSKKAHVLVYMVHDVVNVFGDTYDTAPKNARCQVGRVVRLQNLASSSGIGVTNVAPELCFLCTLG